MKLLFFGLPVAYAICNVAILLAYAKSLLGPVPFPLISLAIAISISGVLVALPAHFVFRDQGFSLPAALFVLAVFSALAVFNIWCWYSATAAV